MKRKKDSTDLTGLQSEIDLILTGSSQPPTNYESYLITDTSTPALPPQSSPTASQQIRVTPLQGKLTKINIRKSTSTQLHQLHIQLLYATLRKMPFLDIVDYLVTEGMKDDAFKKMVAHFKRNTP